MAQHLNHSKEWISRLSGRFSSALRIYGEERSVRLQERGYKAIQFKTTLIPRLRSSLTRSTCTHLNLRPALLHNLSSIHSSRSIRSSMENDGPTILRNRRTTRRTQAQLWRHYERASFGKWTIYRTGDGETDVVCRRIKTVGAEEEIILTIQNCQIWRLNKSAILRVSRVSIDDATLYTYGPSASERSRICVAPPTGVTPSEATSCSIIGVETNGAIPLPQFPPLPREFWSIL